MPRRRTNGPDHWGSGMLLLGVAIMLTGCLASDVDAAISSAEDVLDVLAATSVTEHPSARWIGAVAECGDEAAASLVTGGWVVAAGPSPPQTHVHESRRVIANLHPDLDDAVQGVSEQQEASIRGSLQGAATADACSVVVIHEAAE